MPEPTIVELQVQIAALQRQLAAVQSGSGSIAQGEGNVAAGERGIAVGRDFIGTVYQGAPPKNDAEALALYRRMLARSAGQLPLRGVHVGASDPTSNEKQVDLDQVYVNLDTTAQFWPGEQGKPKGLMNASCLQQLAETLRLGSGRAAAEELTSSLHHEGKKGEPLPAVLATALNRRIVLLGDPGSGKSTFVNHLSLCLALHGLEPSQRWCDRLAGWSEEEASLLPVPVILRDFARTLPAEPSFADASTLWDFISERLTKQRLAAVSQPLEQALEAGQAIILLDGLDEIATATQRKFVREAVLKFIERYHRSRFLITCRTLSYQDATWKLKFRDDSGEEREIPDFTLAPFDEPKIDQFIAAWYGDLVRMGLVKPDDAAPSTRGLQTALRRPDLRPLAPNPLLLTVMALVHTHKGRLPDARALLYEDTVDILLWRWEQLKLPNETETLGLRQLLVKAGRSDVDLKRTLWRLAYEAHRTGGHEERLADIGELTLQTALADLHPDKSRDWARTVIETLKHRAGLLLERLPQVYTFPHRTFQEYLAGAHLASQACFAQNSAKLVEAGSFWRDVVLLGVGKLVYLSGDVDKPFALVGELCPQRAAATPHGWQQVWLAGEVLRELGLPRVQESALGRDLLERVQGRLVELLEAAALTPVERAKAGTVLGRLGDLRSGVGLGPDGLPDLEFTDERMPKGMFKLLEGGKEIPIQKPYRLSRYPVTVAQFQAFVVDKGYEADRFWSEAGRAWRDGKSKMEDMPSWFREVYQRETFPIRGPMDYDPVFQTPNHPRVGVSWYEATAFCAWLSEKGGRKFRLPQEGEWEQAARWNKQQQKADGRTYPWGESEQKELAERCNGHETGIGHTSVVGLFPSGNAECGAADMSGNVWEWCENVYQMSQPWRVLRGGSFVGHPVSLSCSCRGNGHPVLRNSCVGFRVVCASESAR